MKYLSTTAKWIRTNKVEFIVLALILVAGAIMRFYQISEYMTFLGDEGRDAIVVRRLLVYADPILIGPGTSIGGMYLGPLYYYFMAPFLWLANYSPAGPAIGVAILGVATIALVYWVAREWFSKNSEKNNFSVAGLVASGLYAFSPTVIHFSRSSWNPNIMPFFSLLTIYSVWRVWKKDDYKFIIVAGVASAFVLQSHYLGLLILPVIFLIWIFKYIALRAKTVNVRENSGATGFMKKSLAGFFVFVFLMSPLFIFDIRHDWMNYNALKTFFTERQTTVSARPWSALPKIPEIAVQISTSLVGAKNEILGKIILTVVSVASVLLFLRRKKLHHINASGFSIIYLWLFFGLIGFGLYKQHVYDHYFGFLFPAPFLLLGGFAQEVKNSLSKVGQVFLILSISALLYFSILENPLRFSPNRQLQRSENVAQKILDESGGAPFNLAVLAERNYEDGYRYFLEAGGAKVMHADTWDDSTISDQLFVVCEMEKDKCDPTHSPKAEVANFGMTRIDMQWEVDGVIIYKLLHSQ
jgi:4-amino-4-deoxy-L-arabinose transferase-like glycosyltransferase